MSQPSLFALPEPQKRKRPEGGSQPRVRRPEREQRLLIPMDLDAAIGPDHQVRAIWEYVEGLELSELYDRIEAVEGHAGRPATDPRLLLALWLYATVEGVGSARELAELCGEHYAYLWLCGGVSVNYHTLADFRTEAQEVLDRLLTGSVAVLMEAGLVNLKRVAQDGLRVRASAGAASFRREPTLQRFLAAAEAQVAALREELQADPGAGARRQRVARERAARERQARVGAALQELEAVRKSKREEEEKAAARVSTTDPEARVMKMADGGYRPAYNIQFAADTQSQVVVGVSVTNKASDMGQLPAMVEQIGERCGRAPEAMLADGGFAKKEDIVTLAERPSPTLVYAPVQKSKKEALDRHQPRAQDKPVVAEWRQRMGTPEAQAIYKERAATIEWVNAQARNRDLRQVRVRGLGKVLSVALWFGLAHNVMQMLAFGLLRGGP